MTRPVVRVDVSGCRGDLPLLETLLRLTLVARRLGAEMQVVGVGAPFARLLAFSGLDTALDQVLAAGSEPLGQTEPGEEPGVEEVVDVCHPAPAHLEDLDRPRDVAPVGRGLVLGEGG